MNHSNVEAELFKWMEEFVETPHPNLGTWPPCPYARQARLTNNIELRQGNEPYADCLSTVNDNWDKEVIIYWYDHTKIPVENFLADVNNANHLLISEDIVALEDHPNVQEIVSGVKMNFGYCAIIVIQKNSKLNHAADQLRSKGYYDTWSKSDIDKIVSWRLK
jgi:hypothetical protein